MKPKFHNKATMIDVRSSNCKTYTSNNLENAAGNTFPNAYYHLCSWRGWEDGYAL
jgi:hypothetical protein